MSKLVLIDGHSILNRAFYGVPDLTNPEGFHTNAIYGFLNIMFKVLEEENPEAALENFRQGLMLINSQENYNELLHSGFKVLLRDENRTQEETLLLAAEHFGLE